MAGMVAIAAGTLAITTGVEMQAQAMVSIVVVRAGWPKLNIFCSVGTNNAGGGGAAGDNTNTGIADL